MTFDFILEFRNILWNSAELIIEFFGRTLGELLTDLGFNQAGLQVIIPENMLDWTLIEVGLGAGITFVIGYNIVKWLIPIFD